MANYNLTNQTISSSFQQLLQKDTDTGYLVDGIGEDVGDITISGSVSASAFVGDGSGLTNLPIDPLPSGVVSGSSQIALEFAFGDLSGGRINGPVSNADTASYALTSTNAESASIANTATTAILAVSASYALNGGVTSIIAGTNVTIDQSSGDVTINASGGGGTIDTGSFATTGSNSFVGTQIITGSLSGNFSFPMTLTTPLTGSNGNKSKVDYVFQDYGGGTQFKQTITNTDFSYFTSNNGGMIFQTLGSGNIQFEAEGSLNLNTNNNINLNANTNINGNLTQTQVGTNNVRYLQNPDFFSSYYGNALRWNPDAAGGNSTFTVAEKSSAVIQVNAFSGSYDNIVTIKADENSVYFADWDLPSYGDNKWLNIPAQGTPAFQRGLDITGSLGVSGSSTFVGNTTINDSILTINDTANTGSTVIRTDKVYTKSPDGIIESGLYTDYGGSIGLRNTTNSDYFGLALQSENYGYPANWTGPGIYSNDPSDQFQSVIGFQGASNWTDGTVTILKPLDVSGSLSLSTDSELLLPTGSNQQTGTATLDGANPGTVTVSNSLVTANSIILLTKQTFTHTNGHVAVSAKSAGSFTITSNHNADNDVVGYMIINNS